MAAPSGAWALTAVALAMYNSDRVLAADHDGGFAVGVIVILTALRVLREASLELTDTMPDPDMMRRVRGKRRAWTACSVWTGATRKTGFKYHVDLHIEVDPSLTVAESHVIAGQVRSRVREDIGWVADVLVHVEPAESGRREDSPQSPRSVLDPSGR